MTIKDPQGMLARIDQEIMQQNQTIARARLEVSRLQETRLVIMGLAEDDVIIAEQSKLSRIEGMNGAHSVPKLIVRRAGSGDEEGPPPQGLNAAGNRRGMAKGVGKGKHKSGPKRESELAKFRDRITNALTGAEEPMHSREIGDYLGLQRDEKVRKPMQNALYHMRVTGKLQRDAQKRYSLPKQH